VPRRPCVIDGVTYPNQRTAAEALGLSPQALSLRLKMAERRGPDWKPKPRGAAKPVTIHGIAFPTMKAASEGLGIPYRVIQHWARVGRWPNRKVPEQRGGSDRKPRPPGNAQPVTIHGVAFPTMKAASKALGMRYGAIKHWVKTGRWPDPDRRRHPSLPREPVIIDGVAYLSIKDAADKLGIRYGVLYRRLKPARRAKRSRE